MFFENFPFYLFLSLLHGKSLSITHFLLLFTAAYLDISHYVMKRLFSLATQLILRLMYWLLQRLLAPAVV